MSNFNDYYFISFKYLLIYYLLKNIIKSIRNMNIEPMNLMGNLSFQIDNQDLKRMNLIKFNALNFIRYTMFLLVWFNKLFHFLFL